MEFADVMYEVLRENGVEAYVQPHWSGGYARSVDEGPASPVRAVMLETKLLKSVGSENIRNWSYLRPVFWFDSETQKVFFRWANPAKGREPDRLFVLSRHNSHLFPTGLPKKWRRGIFLLKENYNINTVNLDQLIARAKWVRDL